MLLDRIMPAIIHCVRHAQGFHNLGVQFHSYPDPKLTPFGIEQCLNLKNTIWQDQSQLSMVAASPLSRTLHTAFLVFEDALSNGKAMSQILAIPDAQETSDLPCDVGSDLDVLKDICKVQTWPVDLSLMYNDWNVKTIDNRYSPASYAVKARARDTRRFLREKIKAFENTGVKDPQIVLVAHGGYLHYFTEDWEASNKLMGTGWENCETRSYHFAADDEDPDAGLVETMESRRRRGIDYPMLSKDKQVELFEACMQNWRDQGLQDQDVFTSSEKQRSQHANTAMAGKTEIKVAA